MKTQYLSKSAFPKNSVMSKKILSDWPSVMKNISVYEGRRNGDFKKSMKNKNCQPMKVSI